MLKIITFTNVNNSNSKTNDNSFFYPTVLPSSMSDVAMEPVSTTFPPLSSGGSHSQHPPSSEDGLGYSRHYAQRIRDLGKTSKESWIKRLWNHMFGNIRDPVERAGGDTGFPEVSSPDDPSQPHRNSGERRTHQKSHPETTAPKEVRFKEPEGLKSRDGSTGGSREDSHSAPPSKSRPYSAHEKALEHLPVQLLNSPYLPPKDRMVFYHSLKSRDAPSSGVKSRYMNPMSKSMTALGSPSASNARSEGVQFNPHRQSHPYLTQLAREGTSVGPPRARVTRDASVIQLEKRAKTLSDRAIKVSFLLI